MAIRDYDRLFIGGDWVAPEGTDTIGVVSPVTEEVIARVPDGTEADIDKAVAAARTAFDHGPWPRMTPAERAEILRAVAAQVTAEMGDMAEIITREMGSPISFSGMGQVLAPTMIFNYYADLATTYAFDEVRAGLLNPQVLVTKEPVGVVGAIAPWNVPLFIAAAKLAPSLAAGCTVVFKPAPETPLDAFRLAEIFAEAGLPKGVLVRGAGRPRGLRAPGDARGRGQDLVHGVGRRGQAHRRAVRRAAEALHARAGRQVGRHHPRRRRPGDDDPDPAAQRDHEQRPGLHRADPDPGAAGALRRGRRRRRRGRVRHEGGRPHGPGDGGRPRGGRAAAEPDRGVSRQRARGGRDRRAGRRAARRGPRFSKGWYVEPTVFSDVDNKMRIAQEEIFGPVLVVIPYDGDDNAVEIANDSSYGLCGSVWTADNDRGLGVARQVRTGTYMLNALGPDRLLDAVRRVQGVGRRA